MPFLFHADESPPKGNTKHFPTETLRTHRCKVCALDRQGSRLANPKLEPLGSVKPVLYFLGDVPDEAADQAGEPFAPDDYREIVRRLPAELRKRSRFFSAIRCATTSPSLAVSECCRGWAEDDIALTKPLVVFGAGKLALRWGVGVEALHNWRGRLLPIRVKDHTCWFAPILPPRTLAERKGRLAAAAAITFDLDLERVLRLYEQGKLASPAVVQSGHFDGIHVVMGAASGDFERLRGLLRHLQSEPVVGFDIETSGLRPHAPDARILSVAVGTPEMVVAFPLFHRRGWPPHLQHRVASLLLEFLLNSGVKVAHNLKFEQEWLACLFGRNVLRRSEWGDTMLQAYVLDERSGKDLDTQVLLRFGFRLKELSDIDRARVESYPLEQSLVYNGGDAKWTAALYEHNLIELRAEPVLLREYKRLLRATPAIVGAMLEGVPVSLEATRVLNQHFAQRVEDLLHDIKLTPEVRKYEQLLGRFNAHSPDDVVRLLVEVLRRPEASKSKNGEVSVSSDESVLSALPADQVPSAQKILELRTLSKIQSTYIQPALEGRTVYPDGRIHTNYNLTVTSTGRLSSDDPNLQNFPKRKHREVRGMVVAPPGRTFGSLDYGQIEARVIAMASEDKTLVEYMWTAYDIHGYWAEWLARESPSILERMAVDYDAEYDDKKLLMKLLRNEIKNGWVFPQFYGSHVRSCAENLKIADDVAERMSDEFWSMFPGVKRWQERVLKRYERLGYVETLTGRRRRGILSKNELINSPIQGTASDIVVDAMAVLSEMSELDEVKESWQPIMNIHDDLTFLLYLLGLQDTVREIARVMCTPRFEWIIVPLVVEASVGSSWDAQTEIATYRSDIDFGFK